MENKEKIIRELEEDIRRPYFWDDKKIASEKLQKLADFKEEVGKWKALKKELEDIKELDNLSDTDDLKEEIKEKISKIEEKIRNEEIKTFLSGKYDKNNAILEISAGTGGDDAEDWAAMLLRMYERYCQKKGFKVEILSQSFGEGGVIQGRIGIKSTTLRICGNYAYGFLKKENGVHRLVRISPFSAKKLRHTSFTLIEVLPEIEKNFQKDIEIKPEDLKIETFRASGPGGQYVNRRETAVRITHLPTGIVASSQSERLQGKNRENAMKIIYSKLYKLKEEEYQKELKDINKFKVSPSWGNQIRSYVIHPYKLVKDLRTNVESSDVEGILDGDLDKFIDAEIQIKN